MTLLLVRKRVLSLLASTLRFVPVVATWALIIRGQGIPWSYTFSTPSTEMGVPVRWVCSYAPKNPVTTVKKTIRKTMRMMIRTAF